MLGLYQYFENARLNQMPNPIWASVQAFKEYFDDEPYGLTASEINIGIGSALAAGVQGIILNAVDIRFASIDSDTWTSVSNLLSSISYLEDQGYLRIAAPHATPMLSLIISVCIDIMIILSILINFDKF